MFLREFLSKPIAGDQTVGAISALMTFSSGNISGHTISYSISLLYSTYSCACIFVIIAACKSEYCCSDGMAQFAGDHQRGLHM